MDMRGLEIGAAEGIVIFWNLDLELKRFNRAHWTSCRRQVVQTHRTEDEPNPECDLQRDGQPRPQQR